MLLAPMLLALGAVPRRAQHAGPLRGRGDRAARSTTWRSSWRAVVLAPSWASRPRARRRGRLAAATCWSRCRRSCAARLPATCPLDLGDTAARQALAADGAAGDRPRRHARSRSSWSTRRSPRASGRARRRPTTSRSRCSRSRSASSACRWGSCCCPSLSREHRRRRDGRVPASCRARCGCCCS